MTDPSNEPAIPPEHDRTSVADRAGSRHDDAGPSDVTARSGDVDGLFTFLRWMESTAERWEVPRGSVEDVRSAWRAVCGRLATPVDSPVADIDIDLLCERCVQAGLRQATVDSYRIRMLTGRDWYLNWLAGRPRWWRRRNARRYARPTAPATPAAAPDRSTIDIPLRPGVVVTVYLPVDLRPAEADIVHAVLLNMIG
ncbi:hypothetical protein [Virgisporangium aurantiacum]|uniref:Uncharacterized protein n=1 Tax=Virgisporangium aurantiacum TaxID=175570 RepID=A0A8J3ZIX2_9ACTN|nr:hypothetical protein [Virgisporangium aurantiacum]GIJ64937.1 hypothetical protein Vau01_124530 [Virgisporangium aurantiacum]